MDHNSLYNHYNDIIKFYSKKVEYQIALETLDYYFDFIEDMLVNVNNFLVLITTFKETYKDIPFDDEDSIFIFFSKYLNTIKTTQHMDLSIILNNSKNTIYSIRKCVEVLNMADAMTLFRKLKDDLILFVYFLRLGNIVSDDYDTLDKLEKWNNHVQNAYDWVNNSMKNLYSSKVLNLLLKDKQLKKLDKKVNLFSNLFKLNKRLNNFTHSNGMYYITRHNPIYLEKETISTLSYFITEFDKVFSYLFTIVLYFAPQYMASPDYQDHIEMGMDPPEDCQYWVSTYWNRFIKEKVLKVDSQLRDFLKENTCMNIE
ncbi:MAG: hypothetical protein KQ78_01327 [Candidatus Izimaplasma bacterium HR2]|nr:MAG: hypothetical protein KQ78_01327 [Candidatus Izimaplasma bacterium HR2]